jgi:hypothetical protein
MNKNYPIALLTEINIINNSVQKDRNSIKDENMEL